MSGGQILILVLLLPGLLLVVLVVAIVLPRALRDEKRDSGPKDEGGPPAGQQRDTSDD
jgi:hypothetical protein